MIRNVIVSKGADAAALGAHVLGPTGPFDEDWHSPQGSFN
ncbi:conserved hypothetical protein [Mesorhizobium sp. ORS 3324]|nr:conserved hypothetical protein [Mesorhizobium sp. ORS 3324]